MIGIVAAMEMEVKQLVAAMTDVVASTYAGKTFFNGTYMGHAVVVVQSGIGKVNAAHATTMMMERFAPKFLLSTGIAGGLGACKVFDVVVATAVVQHDLDTTAFGDPAGIIPELNVVEVPTNQAANEVLCAILPNAKRGIVASGDQFVSDDQTANRIVKTFGAIACEMESCAVGQVATLYGVPFAVVRLISDGGNDDAYLTYQELATKASDQNATLVLQALPKLAGLF